MARSSIGWALSVAGLGLVGYTAWLGGARAGGLEWTLMSVLGAVAVATIACAGRRVPRVRTALAGALLVTMCGLLAAMVAGHRLFEFDRLFDSRYAAFLGAVLVLTVVGLWRRWFVARWIALALAAAGIVSTGLNLAPRALSPDPYAWLLALHLAGAVLVTANLLRGDVREHFDDNSDPVWTSRDPMLRALRWTMIAHFAAIPMLLVYAWMQPIVAATAPVAIALALILSVSVALAASRKLAGAIGLVLGGAALLVLTAVTVGAAYGRSDFAGHIALYYAVFWVPAGLTAVLCGARLAGPVFRLLRR